MIIGIPKELPLSEKRVAATPTSVKKLISQGFEVWIEKNAGLSSLFYDSQYIDCGASIKKNSTEIFNSSDIILSVCPPVTIKNKNLKKSSVIIGNFQNLMPSSYLKNSTCFALEKLPRISKSQPFDILSSQNNLSGYQAVIKATSLLKKSIPMMITSAGTITPVKFLIIGLGVAGLQAIATAKRLGAKIYAHDIRSETKEQAKSLGAIFIENINDILNDIDVIIASAFYPTSKAPILITENDIKKMTKGSVLIDMAITQGGNIEHSKNLKIINFNDNQIYADSNLANEIPQTASQLYANNLSNFIDYLKITPQNIPSFNLNDDIIKSTLIYGG